jgi:hypothetical protein
MKAKDWTYTGEGSMLFLYQPAASKRYTWAFALVTKKDLALSAVRYTTEEESFDRAHPAAAYAAAS